MSFTLASETEEDRKIISSPPFVVVEGVINVRDLGGYATSNSDLVVKSSSVFRSGELSHITDHGREQLRALRITKIFDMRSDSEIASYKTEAPVIEGIEFVRVPVSQTEAYDLVSLAVRLQSFHTDELNTFVTLYTEILENGAGAFENIFTHLKNKPDEPCLVHCTAGKDRAGLFTALFLLLLGVSDDDIIHDYTLTTVGLKPVLPMLSERFQKVQVYRDNWEGLQNMGSAKPATMAATLKIIREKYGGVDGYFTGHTNLTEENLATIRKSFLVPRSV